METRRSSLVAWAGILALAACDRQVLVGARSGAGGAAGGAAGVGSGGAGGNAGVAGVADCAPLPSIPRRLWRLTSDQYANSVRDLLSLGSAPVIAPNSSDGSSPGSFVNGADLLFVQPSYLFSLYSTAGNVAAQIGSRASDTCSGPLCLASCLPGESHQDCAMRFAQSFETQAFRRPLDPDEVASLMNVYASVCPGPSPTCASSDDFSAAISLMAKAVILAPSFLYRRELGPPTLAADTAGNYPSTSLTPFEVATQLAYLFLNSTPDSGLRLAAANGRLGTAAGIASEVNRLMTLPAVRQNLTHVVTNWFGIGQLPAQTNVDPALLSALAPAERDPAAIVDELAASAGALVDDVLWTNPAGKVTDLLTTRKAFLTNRLARLYGLPASGGGTALTAFDWPVTEQRAGLLTDPAYLWAWSSSSSIIQRGLFLRNQVLCQDPLPPEPDLTSPEALAIIATGNSEATRSQARLGNDTVCRACHVQIDPYGKLLQGFDRIGGHRAVDEVGAPIDLTAAFVSPSPLAAMTLSGPPDLGAALISTNVFAGCAVQQMVRYTTGAPQVPWQTCELNALRRQFGSTDGTMSSLFGDILGADFVRARAGGPK